MLLGAFWSAPAFASHDLSLTELTCAGGAPSAGAAFALQPADLDCSEDRFEQSERFVRTHVDLSRTFLPPGEQLLWQTDPSAFDTMLLRFTYADGSESLVDVDPQMAARNWFARMRFSVPVPRTDSRLVAVDAAIERPRTIHPASGARLIGADTAEREHFVRVLIYAVILGLLINPILYDLIFYRVLRARFMLWHMAMVAAIFVFALANTGLVFELLPDLPMLTRWKLNAVSLTLALACAVLFVRKLLETRAIPPPVDRLLLGAVALSVAMAVLLLFDLEALRTAMNRLWLLSLIPLGVVVIAATGAAFARGSRAVRFIVPAVVAMAFVGLLRLAVGVGLFDTGIAFADFLLVALVIVALATSAAVGDRFMVIRTERDRARMQAVRLGQMAHTDGLTGLANRRAFDQIARLEIGRALIVADLDHFKRINDTMGHLMGDAVLCRAAKVLRYALEDRSDARLFRLGGEEFAVIADCGDTNELQSLAETIRVCVEELSGHEPSDMPTLTVSVGGVLGTGQPLHEAFAAADGAMYRAKDEGRNRSALASEEE